MKFLRRMVFAMGYFKFLIFIGGVGALPSLFYFQRFADSLNEAILIIVAPFIFFVIVGFILLRISKVSRKDLSEKRAEQRTAARDRFKKMPAYQKALVVLGIIVLIIIFNAADFLSLFD